MATTIKLKRKKSSGNSGIILLAGEPYYNIEDKHLYVGNSDNEDATSKKHIAEITANSTADNVVSFQIGEATDNIFEKIINNVNNAHDLSNLTLTAEGTTLHLTWGENNEKKASAVIQIDSSTIDDYIETAEFKESVTTIVEENTSYLATKTYVDNAVKNSTSSSVSQIFQAGTSSPVNTKLLWIDTNSTTGGLKYYNGSGWVPVPVSYV